MLFQGHASLVYPYALRSERQQQFVRDCVGRRSEWNILNDAILFKKTRGAPPLLLHQSTVLVALCDRVASAVGGRGACSAPGATGANSAPGGTGAHTAAGRGGQSNAEPSKGDQSRIALCNIILQRLQGYVTIDKPVQKDLHDWLARKKAEAGGAANINEEAKHPGAAAQESRCESPSGQP